MAWTGERKPDESLLSEGCFYAGLYGESHMSV